MTAIKVVRSDLRKWRSLAVLSFAAFFLIGGTVASLTVYIPVLETVEGWSPGAIGGAATALLFSMSLCGIFAGALVDRFSGRVVISIAMLIAALGCLLAAYALSITHFTAALALIGIGTGATTVPAMAVITRLFTEHRALALGIYMGAMSLASAGMPPIVGLVIETDGWRSAMIITGALIVVSCLMVASVRITTSAGVGEAGDAHAEASAGLTVSEGLRSRGFWLTTLAVTLAVFSVNGAMLAVIAYFVNGKIPFSVAVYIYSITNLLGVPAVLLGGVLADRFGARKVFMWALILQGVGTLVLIAAFVPGAYGWIAIGLFMILWGFAGGLPPQIAPVLIADVVGMRNFGALLGVCFAAEGLTSALAPWGTGWILEMGGSYELVFIIYGALVIAATPLILFVRSYAP